MFSTKEIKDVVHTFPIRDRNISNSVIDDGLIPSESKDGFVQVQTLQGALKNAIEDEKKRLSVSSFASNYDVKRNLVLELLDRSYPDIVWSRNWDEVLSRFEQHHLRQRLVDYSLDQFVDVDKFLLKHDIHKLSLAQIHEPSLLMKTVDCDGKRYIHSAQLTDKVTKYIRGRLSLAEQDKNIVKLAPGDLPGHPPVYLISEIVRGLSFEAGGAFKGEQIIEDSEVKFTPGSHKQKEIETQLLEIKYGEKLYMEGCFSMKYSLHRFIYSGGIKVYGHYLVSSVLLKQISSKLKTQLLDIGYAHVPMSEGSQEISQGLHNIIILNLTEVYEQSNFKYVYPYVISHYWLDRMKEGLIEIVDCSLQFRWDSASPLDPLDNPPNVLELRQNSPALDGMPMDLFNVLLSTEFWNIVKDRHAMKLRALQEEADHTFKAFWLQHVSATIELFIQALLKVKDENFRNQLSVTLALFIRTTLVPKAITKVVARRLVRRGDLAEELSKLQKDLEPFSTPPSSSHSSATDYPRVNAFYEYLESSFSTIVNFSAQFNMPHMSFRTSRKLQHLMCFSSSPSNSASTSPVRPSSPSPPEPSIDPEEIPTTFLEARKVALFEDMRHSMVDEADDARLFLKMLIILFGRWHEVMIYASGKAAPKLLKELVHYRLEIVRTYEKKKKRLYRKKQEGKKEEQMQRDDENDDDERKSIEGTTEGDPMTGVEPTTAEPDTDMAYNQGMEEMEEDPRPSPSAELKSASPSKHEPSTKAVSTIEGEKFIPFTPPQHLYRIPIHSFENPYYGRRIYFLSSEFPARMNGLKDRIKAGKVTHDDRLYMKAVAGVIDARSGEVLLNGYRDERGKWIKGVRNGASGGRTEEEEEIEIKNWFRMRYETGTSLL